MKSASCLQRFGCESVGFMDEFAEQRLLLAFRYRGHLVQLRACGSASGAPQSSYSRLASFVIVHDNVIRSTEKGESTMAANKLVQARIDGAVKEEAASVLAAMGLTVSDAVRLLLTRVAQEKALPFAPLIPNTVTIEAMKEARKGGLPQFDSVQALMNDLHAQD